MPTPQQKRLLLNRLASGLSFLLRDDFTSTWLNSLASPRTSLPGPGTLVITDANAKLSIVGGKLSFATGGVGSGNPAMWGAQLSRLAGRTLVAKANFSVSGAEIGWDSDTAGNLQDTIRVIPGSSILREAGSASFAADTFAVSTDYSIAAVMRSAGWLGFIKGGAFTNWTLAWVGVGSTGSMYPAISVSGTTTVGTIDLFRALDLPAPFDTDYGLATQRLAGARAANDTFTHTADCVIEWTQTTLPSAPETRMAFRLQDATNFWRIVIDNSGNMTLTEMVAGSGTSRGTAAGVVSSGHRIVVVCDGTTIRVYSNNVLRITYASASNFATAVSGKLELLGTSGAVSDIVSWPRTITGSPATLLDNAIAGTGTFLLNDDFAITEGGSLPSPRVAEPGPGVLTINSGASNLSIVSGKLHHDGGAQSVITWPSQIRVAGRAAFAKYTRASGSTRCTIIGGWGTSSQDEVRNFSTELRIIHNELVATITNGVEYSLALAARTAGSLYFVKGGAFTSWTLLWAYNTSTAALATVTDWEAATSLATDVDGLRMLDLPAPFTDDYGLVTQRLSGARSAGDTFTHEANCVIEYVVTTLGSSSNRVFVRMQDASNYWRIDIDTLGTITLGEVVATVNTTRATASTVVASGHRVIVVCDGTTIRVYSNNVLRITYSSASNFATATAGILSTLGTGGAVSDIVSWPRVLGAAPAALLDLAVA